VIIVANQKSYNTASYPALQRHMPSLIEQSDSADSCSFYTDLDNFTGFDDMRIGLAAMAADRQNILGDLAAKLFERQVVEVVAERVFDLDADLLDPEKRPYRPCRVFARSAAGSG
jgi:hypothetical protein